MSNILCSCKRKKWKSKRERERCVVSTNTGKIGLEVPEACVGERGEREKGWQKGKEKNKDKGLCMSVYSL